MTAYQGIRRDWVITLTAEDGTVTYSTPICQPDDGDHWSWDGCNGTDEDIFINTFIQVLPGRYEVGFIRVDLPDKNNLDLERELRWRTHEKVGDSIQFQFEAAPDGAEILLDTLLDEPTTLVDPRASCN